MCRLAQSKSMVMGFGEIYFGTLGFHSTDGWMNGVVILKVI